MSEILLESLLDVLQILGRSSLLVVCDDPGTRKGCHYTFRDDITFYWFSIERKIGSLFHIAPPRQDDGNRRENYRVHERDQQRMCAIHLHERWYPDGKDLGGHNDGWHYIQVRPKEIGRDVLPEVVVSESEGENHEGDADIVSRKPRQCDTQPEDLRAPQDGYCCRQKDSHTHASHDSEDIQPGVGPERGGQSTQRIQISCQQGQNHAHQDGIEQEATDKEYERNDHHC